MTPSNTTRSIALSAALLVMYGALLTGCASYGHRVYSYPAEPLIARRLPRSERRDPVLEKVTMTFETLQYPKKATSGIWVLSVNNTWNDTLVRSSNLAETENVSNEYAVRDAYFAPYSTHTLDLPFARSRYGYDLFASDLDRQHLLDRIPRSERRVWRKSNCERLYFKVGLMARSALLGTTGNTFGFDRQNTYSGFGGENKWSFNAFLTLYFNDGSKLVYARRNLTLDSHNGKLVFIRAR